MLFKRVIIKDTHRGLWYEDGKLVRILEGGSYRVPKPLDWGVYRRPLVELVLVDMRERDLTIKGQQILTADKVAIRVSIIVQFRVTDPRAALHEVKNYEERLYGDVQLAARRSLATMPLEEILTNRNRLSDDILRDVKEAAASYGVAILRADVKDLMFPGDLQDIMNRVLSAERLSQAQLVEARTKAEVRQIEARAKAEGDRIEAEALAGRRRIAAETDAEAVRVQTQAEIDALREREKAAAAYTDHPALLRLRELDTLSALAQAGKANVYIGFDRPGSPRANDHRDG